MDLRMWLDKNKIMLRDFAKLLDYDRCYMSSVMNFRLRPSFKMAKLIEKHTKGQVSAYEIMEKQYDNMKNDDIEKK